MGYVATDLDIEVARQPYRELFLKINVLDLSMRIVDEISGMCIGGNISIDANSDIRRTCRIEMAINDYSLNISSGSDIWLDKYIQLYVGVKHIVTQEIVWYNCGMYLINKPNIEYSADRYILSFEGVDLMSKLTGLRNGMLEAITTKIEAGENMRNVLVSVITQLGGFQKYTIDCEDKEIPYDITIDVGGTVYDLLSQIRDIYPNYEMFFDVDGVFVFQEIPDGYDDEISVENKLLKELVISESVEINFEDVKNKVAVLGKSLDPDEYGGDATVSSGAYNITLEGKQSIATNEMIGFTINQIVSNPKLKISNGTTTLITGNIVNEDGTAAVFPENNEYYVVKKQINDTFLYMGRQQPMYTSIDDNEDSPFCTSKIGEIYLVLYGGEFDNITTDDLCRQRADYELWKRTRLNDCLNIEIVPLYWMDVNTKIAYEDINSGRVNQYIIKSIDIDLGVGGTQQVNAIKFYPLYPEF